MKRHKILIPIILLAFFLRVWQLPTIPPGLWYDEAYYAMDAAWLLDGGPWQLFFAGNNGREPIFIYLQALFIGIFGAQPLTSRLLGPLLGTLTAPLVYILARRLSRSFINHYPLPAPRLNSPTIILDLPQWFSYLAAAGLATSFWHVSLSRGGFRGILLPLAATLIFYAFWRGWQERSRYWMGLAGLSLGLSQYTYLSARTLPLVFAVFAAAWTALHWRDRARRTTLWLELVGMAVISALVFAPLGWIFYQNPPLFSARTGDVLFTPATPAELWQHLAEAIRLFVDGGDPNWRHHLPGRPMLGWLGWLGFWPGFIICLRQLRRDVSLFLVIALLTLFMPALLAVPPIHALRLSALLPIYYLTFAWGLIGLIQLTLRKLSSTTQSSMSTRATRSGWAISPRLLVVGLIVIMALETSLTIFDYFFRWAKAEETYIEYNGPLVDFVNHVIDQTTQNAVIIPFQLYVHPTTRYLLHDHFTEQVAPANLRGPTQLVSIPNEFQILNVGNIPGTPAWVWLAQNPGKSGAAYVSRPARLEEQSYLKSVMAEVIPEIFKDRLGRELAQLRRLDNPAPLVPLFTQTAPQRSLSLNWANLVQLEGYEVSPPVVQPGQPLSLNFYWHSFTDKTFDQSLFLQLIDAAGNPINQWEGDAFREDMYRWRPAGILPSQHTLWLGAQTPPGPYLVRLGFFNPRSSQRLPLFKAEGGEVDQIQVGLFYVSADGRDPRQPATPLSATFGDSVKLIGVTLPDFSSPLLPTPHSLLPVTFHWQVLHPTDQPYTVFLQLLDQSGQVITGWDSQPFNQLYPTNLWSPGELIADTFQLSLPPEGLAPGQYRLITGFYDVNTGQRLPVDLGGDFAKLAEWTVSRPFSTLYRQR